MTRAQEDEAVGPGLEGKAASAAPARPHHGFLSQESLRAGPILDIEVDHGRQLLVLTRDGVAMPTYLTTPDALRAGALVADLAESR